MSIAVWCQAEYNLGFVACGQFFIEGIRDPEVKERLKMFKESNRSEFLVEALEVEAACIENHTTKTLRRRLQTLSESSRTWRNRAYQNGLSDDNWSPDQDKKDQLEDGDPLLLQKKQNEPRPTWHFVLSETRLWLKTAG